KRNEDKFEEADYYKEEIRKRLIFLLGSDDLYKKGLVIKTSIDTKYQKIIENALFNGLISQDKKSGWRGPIYNDITFEFNKEIKNPFPHKWEIYQILEILDREIKIRNKRNEIKKLFLDSVNNNWLMDEKFYKGDLLFIEDIKDELIVRQIPQVNGAIIAIDPHSGKVLALSGGFSFKLSQFNRATQAKRQPGSAFKPFVYITALKEGYNPSTLVLDAPYVVDQGPGLPKWKPSNYSDKFYGLNTIRTGIEKSRNLMTIRLSDKIGMNKILETAKDFRIEKHMDNNLSMSLGAGLVSLIDITNAYAMIVNGGKVIRPTLILSVSDKNGNQIINNENKICNSCIQNDRNLDYKIPKILNNQQSILDDKIAYQITSMLNGVVLRGTGKKIRSLDTPLAGKTGTTNDNKDAWFIGFSPDIAVGVYIGYDNPKSLGFKQTGSEVAVPIFKDFMKQANININKTPFRIPSGLSFVKIDPKSGLPTSDSKGILEPFILGTEPYNINNIKKLDNLITINNNSISGTGSLLNE
ncbi:penicillin-binding transpeptidase domain-containing protein, partial [Alphaproteobacteria bacterium]|nr:penicillin-binding transpeptidase domain-containing protein [Alphaproteobacteria bacterium]